MTLVHQRRDDAEEALRLSLLAMGAHAEAMIADAAAILFERRDGARAELDRREREVNRLHVAVDEQCLTIIARYQPMAVDVRTVLAIARMNADLERIGDQAVNVAQNAAIVNGLPGPSAPPLDLPRMASLAAAMVHDALEAFARRDPATAREVIRRDDEEDALKSQAFHDLMRIMQTDSSAIQRGLGLILIARNLERIADHATNLAEDVIFMVLGEDVRHGGET